MRNMTRIRKGRYYRPMSDEEIYHLVDDILETMPEDLAEAIENVGIHIEEVPTREMLDGQGHLSPGILGLYVGVPLPNQSVMGPAPIPAQIFLFRRNIERYARTNDDVTEELRVTLIHEIGHHLGLDEDDLAARGL